MSRTLFIAAAAVLALGAGFVAQRALTGRGDASSASVPVLVAVADLEIGQTVTEKHLTWQQWPKANLNAHYMTAIAKPEARKALVGAVVRQPVTAGEPVTAAKLLKRDNASVLAVVLEEGMRAVSIKVDEAQSVAGLVRPGDRVDVILTHKVTSTQDAAQAGEKSVSEAVARNVRVLAVGQDVKAEENTPNGKQQKLAKSVTLEVDAKQAEAVTLGRTLGSLSLSLRSVLSDGGDDEADAADQVKPWTSDEDVSALLRRERGRKARVLAAARPLTAGDFLTDADLAWIEVEKGADLARAFVDARDGGDHRLTGALLLSDLTAGQPLSRDVVVKPGENRFVPRALRPGYRAVSVAIAGNTAVGGFVAPGDLVDVVFTNKVTDTSEGARVRERNWSETVATGVRVLSVETALDPTTQLPAAGGTATLEARPRQVEAISLAGAMGHLTLALRPPGDVAELPPEAADAAAQGFITDMELSSGLRALVGGARTKPQAKANELVLIRGGAREVVMLGRD